MTVLLQPPYSPDLTLCEFFLFPKLKSVLKGHYFDIIDDKNKSIKGIAGLQLEKVCE